MKPFLPFCFLVFSSFLFIAAGAQTYSVSIAPQTCSNATLQAIVSNPKKADTLRWYDHNVPVQVSIHGNLNPAIDTVTTQNVFALIGYDDVVLDDSGNVYATSDACVIYEYVKKTGAWIEPAGNSDCVGNNTLLSPTGIAVDPQGNIYIAEASGHRVTKWHNGVRTVVADGLGIPFKLSLDKDNSLYILDQGNNAVYKLKNGARNYTLAAGGNGAGPALNQLNTPTCLAVDTDMNVYVGDPNNNRVVKWAPGAAIGTVVAGGGSNIGSVYDIHPIDLQVDAQNRLFIIDGTNLVYWPAQSSFGINVGKIYPDDYDASIAYPVFIDKNHNVYEGKSGYLVKFSPNLALDTTHYAPYETSAWYRAEARYSNGYTAASDSLQLVSEPYQPLIEGQYGGTCHLTLPYDNYYYDDPTNPVITWTAPAHTHLVSGQGTDHIRLQFTDSFITGQLTLTTSNACRSYTTYRDLSAAPVSEQIHGRKKVSPNQKNVRYYVYGAEANSVYTWSVPNGAIITKGQGTDSIQVTFGTASGKISVVTSNDCGTVSNHTLKITVDPPGIADKEVAFPGLSVNDDRNLLLYPQPVRNTATLQFYAAKSDVYSISVTDLSGKVVYAGQKSAGAGINTVLLDVSALASGTYIVSLYNKTEVPKSVKLMKSAQ